MALRGFIEIFLNELRALSRSRTIHILFLLSVAWMFVCPMVFRGDGTAGGARELTLRYSLGGVAALLAVSLTVAAAGALSRERAAKRLQLTMVRPVRCFIVALGKMCAITAVAAVVLGAAALIEEFRSGFGSARPCRHVYHPVMPSPQEEAEEMYRVYMASTNTPEAVRKASPAVVKRLLAQRAVDRYDTIAPASSFEWRFPVADDDGQPVLRFRFTNSYGMRDDVCCGLRFGAFAGAVSNITQAVVEVPMTRASGGGIARDVLQLDNLGKNGVMLRPRKDVELLLAADSFGWNLFRAYVELLALLSLLIAFGVFLGAGLGRPAAVFTALAVIALGEMCPSVIEQYPHELKTGGADAIGLALTRFAAEVTHPLSALNPLESLGRDECVEGREALRAFAADAVLLPLIFAFLSALAMPRKTQ